MHDESHPDSARRLGEIRAIAGCTRCRERLRRLLAERSPEALELRGFGARDRPGVAAGWPGSAPPSHQRRGLGAVTANWSAPDQTVAPGDASSVHAAIAEVSNRKDGMSPEPQRRAAQRLREAFAAEPELAETVRSLFADVPPDVPDRFMWHLGTRLGRARRSGGALIPALTDTIEDALERWEREALEARDRRPQRNGQNPADGSLRTRSGPSHRDRRHRWLGRCLAGLDPNRDPGQR